MGGDYTETLFSLQPTLEGQKPGWRPLSLSLSLYDARPLVCLGVSEREITTGHAFTHLGGAYNYTIIDTPQRPRGLRHNILCRAMYTT